MPEFISLEIVLITLGVIAILTMIMVDVLSKTLPKKSNIISNIEDEKLEDMIGENQVVKDEFFNIKNNTDAIKSSQKQRKTVSVSNTNSIVSNFIAMFKFYHCRFKYFWRSYFVEKQIKAEIRIRRRTLAVKSNKIRTPSCLLFNCKQVLFKQLNLAAEIFSFLKMFFNIPTLKMTELLAV